jgi:hypothetical protein
MLGLKQPYSSEESDFFSLDRYRYTYLYFQKIAYSDSAPGSFAEVRIRQFAQSFTRGFDLLANGERDKALGQFKKTSRMVPEYFHTDFIIGLILEEEGEHKRAASFYRSYLDKLKKYKAGRYRFTGPLIEQTVDFYIPDYEVAEGLISSRMDEYGIDINRVSPYRPRSLFMIISYLIIAAGLIYGIVKLPPVKRLIFKTRSGLNRSSEYWICQFCGKSNGNINSACYNCGKARKG